MIHKLYTDIQPPEQFTFPFCYEPHPLCLQAKEEVVKYIESHPEIHQDAQTGKMFGILVVAPEMSVNNKNEHYYLAAYSGLLAGRNDWDWFVPPVFDAQQKDGYFKTHEQEISLINEQIKEIEKSADYLSSKKDYQQSERQMRQLVDDYKRKMAAAKMNRDEQRLYRNPSPEEQAALIRESQFMKAELRRLKKSQEDLIKDKRERYEQFTAQIEALKAKRKELSDQLQQWLFAQYHLLNARGEKKDLIEIFDAYKGELPPGGAGDCCAPKLLQYAYQHHLKPLCMMEFWYGQSPKAEVRHHLQHYPSCRSKCLPILSFMMQGLQVEPNPMEHRETAEIKIIYEDESLLVVDKPAGMLSVPGKIQGPSVETFVRHYLHDEVNPLIVHRLDMETSGLMVLAKTKWIHQELQRQFEQHLIKKVYIAILDGKPAAKRRISLPIRPNIEDRPRQMVDYEYGKEAVTDIEILEEKEGKTRVALYPQTGRTHQLRIHCAHEEGLGCPIMGDTLYGKTADRLYLHAWKITFTHPKTQETLTFVADPAF